jgi:hypothetical protein
VDSVSPHEKNKKNNVGVSSAFFCLRIARRLSPSASKKGGEFLEQFSDCQCLKKDFAKGVSWMFVGGISS